MTELYTSITTALEIEAAIKPLGYKYRIGVDRNHSPFIEIELPDARIGKAVFGGMRLVIGIQYGWITTSIIQIDNDNDLQRHPHVGTSRYLCSGYSARMESLANNGKWDELISTSLMAISTFTPSGAYVFPDNVMRCSFCGEWNTESKELYVCQWCEECSCREHLCAICQVRRPCAKHSIFIESESMTICQHCINVIGLRQNSTVEEIREAFYTGDCSRCYRRNTTIVLAACCGAFLCIDCAGYWKCNNRSCLNIMCVECHSHSALCPSCREASTRTPLVEVQDGVAR